MLADVIEDTEAAGKCLLGLELAVEGHPGGVVGGKDERSRRQGGAEPRVGATIDEDELAETGPALAPSAVIAL